MTLPIPFSVYGMVYKADGVSPIDSGTAQIVDNTNNQGTLSVSIGNDGKYVGNVRDYVSIGDTISVTVYSAGETDTDTFTLSLIPPSERLDFILDIAGLSFIYGSTIIKLATPSVILESITNSIQNLVFHDGTDIQLNRGKLSDSLTLSGQETSSATDVMRDLNSLIDDQVVVTLGGLPDSYLNTDYRISNFDFNKEAGMVDRYRYNISLERIYDRLG